MRSEELKLMFTVNHATAVSFNYSATSSLLSSSFNPKKFSVNHQKFPVSFASNCKRFAVSTQLQNYISLGSSELSYLEKMVDTARFLIIAPAVLVTVNTTVRLFTSMSVERYLHYTFRHFSILECSDTLNATVIH